MRAAAAATLLLVLAPGCLSITETSYPVAVCLETYPDGTPKDCQRDDAVSASAAAPQGPGWACLAYLEAQPGGWDLRYELWRSDGGEWRIGLIGHGTGPADAVLTAVALHAGGGIAASRIVSTRSDGWVSLGQAAGAGTLTVWTVAIEVDRPAEVLATDWGSGLWVVYADPAGSWAMDGTARPEGADGYQPVDMTFAVDGLIYTVDQSTLLRRTAHFTPLVQLPGLGLPCDSS